MRPSPMSIAPTLSGLHSPEPQDSASAEDKGIGRSLQPTAELRRDFPATTAPGPSPCEDARQQNSLSAIHRFSASCLPVRLADRFLKDGSPAKLQELADSLVLVPGATDMSPETGQLPHCPRQSFGSQPASPDAARG